MSCAGITLILDVDGTLTPTPHKAHGMYLPLTESPCLAPVIEFLKQDGRLCACSTAGKRLWTQIYQPLIPTLTELHRRDPAFKGRLMFGSYTGATLYSSDGPQQMLVEDEEYRLENKTTMDPKKVPGALDLLRGVVIKIFDTMASDPTYLPLLSKKYTSVFGNLNEEREEMGKERFDAVCLSMENILLHGRYLSDSNDALLDVQYVVGQEEHAVVAHINVLGVPMARFAQIFTPELCQLLEQTYGISARAQPNSVCLAVDGLDKGTIVRFLLKHAKTKDKAYLLHPAWDPQAAIGGGDIPQSVDAPLSQYPPIRFDRRVDAGAAGHRQAGAREEDAEWPEERRRAGCGCCC
jgi:hypothetical protein